MPSTELTMSTIAVARPAALPPPPSAGSPTRAIAPAAYRQERRSVVGLVAVLAFHVAVVWVLVSGLGKSVVDVIRAPIETRVVDEAKKPPPPEKQLLPPPTLAAPPPPAYIPPPEVAVALPPVPAPSITTTREAPPAPVAIVPSPPATAPVAALPAPVARPAGKPARIDVTSCEKPEYPEAAARAAATGTTKIRFAVDAAGTVVKADIERPSGTLREHRLLDRAAVAALGKCRFTPGTDEQGAPVGGDAIVDYVWQVD